MPINSFNLENKKNVAKILEYLFNVDFPINKRVFKRIFHEMIWSSTEDSNEGKSCKYLSQPIWSHEALKKCYQNKLERKKITDGLRHEHVVNKVVIIQMISNLENKSFDNILNILDVYAHAAVITIDEDKKLTSLSFRSKMPEGYEKDIFIRYRRAEILLCNYLNTKDIKELNKENLENLLRNKLFNY